MGDSHTYLIVEGILGMNFFLLDSAAFFLFLLPPTRSKRFPIPPPPPFSAAAAAAAAGADGDGRGREGGG